MNIVIEHLSFSYGRHAALDDVNVAARPGRLTAIIGPNAAGKSTLLRCVIGTLSPRAGRVLINGAGAHRLHASQLAAAIAYVPQRPVVSAAFTVRQVVALGRYALPPAPNRVEQAIARMDLREVADRPFPALSVGQQQRVTMARALAQLADNGCLVLDEPWSAMDLRHVQDCIRSIREMTGRGATVLIALHDLPLAATIADDVWVLGKGKLLAAGPAMEVMTIERLRDVFEVGFNRIAGPAGQSVLIPQLIAQGESGSATLGKKS